MAKYLSTRISVVSRSKGGSAVDKASYISREELYCEYDGKTYRPKAKEDLVHSEINLPENAPIEYGAREILWNSVEASEKAKNAQLCRMMKASLPNEWTYEIAEEVVRQYVKENFVSKGMCVDWAIHDSINKKGERNLHFHCLMTLRAIDENGKWLPKQRKVYILDENGNKIRKDKNYKCKTEFTTDWNDKSKAKEWRKNLRDMINATNETLNIEEKWEYRSFKELGLDILPTIHLGSKANALEEKGIHTERGDYNRRVLEIRWLVDYINKTSATIEQLASAVKEKATVAKNEITNLIDAVVNRHGRLQLPIISGRYLRKVSHRERLQDAENMKAFADRKGITTFDELKEYQEKHEKEYNSLSDSYSDGQSRAMQLQLKIDAYEDYKPYGEAKKKSMSLKGLEKWSYDRKNKAMLDAHPAELEKLRKFIPEGEKVTISAWEKQISEIEANQTPLEKKMSKEVRNLAYAEVLDYNKSNEAREKANEQRARERQLTKTRTSKRHEPEL